MGTEDPPEQTVYDVYLRALDRVKAWLRNAASVSPSAPKEAAPSPPGIPSALPIGPAPPAASPDAVPDRHRQIAGRTLVDRLAQLEMQMAAAQARPRAAGPARRLSGRPMQFWASALAVATLTLGLRLFQLDRLQNEFYGDINIVYEYVDRIRAGQWPFYFDQSSGPLYHYLITPLINLTGLNYFGLKLATSIASLATLAMIYAVSRRLLGDGFALLATAVAGVSSWLLIFSRVGNSQIIVPLLVMTALWLALRFAQQGRRRADLIACAVVSALGLYGYPQSFILPLVVLLLLLYLRWSEGRIRWSDLGWFVAVTVVVGLPFAWIVYDNPAPFFTGYIGGKLEPTRNPFMAIVQNSIGALAAFHVRGDLVARSNPAGLPHLDWLSGLLFLGGAVFWLSPERRRRSPVLLLPFLLLQVPSILVLSSQGEVPSASRTLGVAPLAYILVASGLWWLVGAISRRGSRMVALGTGSLLLALILSLNMRRYFKDYVSGLPYGNTPVARLVTDYVDALPAETQIYLAGCCWKSGMPEPKSVRYAMLHPENLHELKTDDVTCQRLQLLPGPAVLIWSDEDALPAPGIAECQELLMPQLFVGARGQPTFHASTLRSTVFAASIAAGADPGLELTVAEMDGQAVGVRHSALDIGQVADLFDGKLDSLLRGRSDNPLVLELQFAQPRTAQTVSLTVGTMAHFKIRMLLTYADGGSEELTQDYENLPSDPQVDIALPRPDRPFQALRLEIEDMALPPGEGYHIHVRELQIR